MRLNRLDLVRYGKFTDHLVEFGDKQAGRPDFHLIYGPNEAGKSTILSAFLDLLFGIEVRTKYDFLHDKAVMRIAARLDLMSGTKDFIRVKKAQNSLLDAAGRALLEHEIAGDFGGIDRASYRNMFSLDDESLESGGEDIIASKGDVGQLLYAASAGIADLSKILAGIRGEADEFYKKGGRSHALHTLKQTLDELKKQREEIDISAADHARLVDEKSKLKAIYEGVFNERQKVLSRQGQVQGLLNALPRLAALRSIREQLKPLAGLPDILPGWAETLPGLRENETKLSVEEEIVAQDIEKRGLALNALVVDEIALAMAARRPKLEDLKARYVTAEKDIPWLQTELHGVDQTIETIMRRIGRSGEPEPASLLLSTRHLAALNRLIETKSTIETAFVAAQEEEAKARLRLDKEKQRFARTVGDAQGQTLHQRHFNGFAVAIAGLKNSDHAARKKLADRDYTAQYKLWTERMGELSPWCDEITVLLAMRVPQTDEIEHWKLSIASAEQAVTLCKAERDRLEQEQRRRAESVENITHIYGIVPDEDLAKSRADREAAWAAHRQKLDAESADIFEQKLRYDDELLEASHAHETEIAKLKQAKLDCAEIEFDLRESGVSCAQADVLLKKVQDEISAAIKLMTPGLPETMKISQWDAWLQRRARAVEAWKHVCVAQTSIDEAREDAENAHRKIITAFDVAGLFCDKTASYDALMSLAQGILEREAQLRAISDIVSHAEDELAEREHLTAMSMEKEKAWSASWQEACAACWLGQADVLPDFSVVRDIIKELAVLKAELDKRDGLNSRIKAMAQDQSQFSDLIAGIAQEMKLNLTSDSVMDFSRAIENAIQTAQTKESIWKQQQEELRLAEEKQGELQKTIETYRQQKQQMLTSFNAQTLDEVAVILEQIKSKQQFLVYQAQAMGDIVAITGLGTSEEAEASLCKADQDLLKAEQDGLKLKFEDYDRRTRDLATDCGRLEDQIKKIGGDDSVARIEAKRRVIQMEIDNQAALYLRLRLGTAAAGYALRLYRNQHRSSMMQQASHAFQTISRGAYVRLDTHFEKEAEVLVAIGADGGSKLASELSKGTRFQLYLALRVAAYLESARTRPALPFIADDIMETFDDFRAEEAFRLFTEMASVGQVIYLTHHQHLVEIARRICPDVKVHQLV